MNTYLLLKLCHELMAIWFIGGILGRQLVRAQARSSNNLKEFTRLSQVANRFEALMVIPGNLLVIGFGVLVGWWGGWPIFGFLQGASANWLLLSNLLLVAGFFIVPLIYLPRGKVFDQALKEAQAAGQMTPALLATLDDPVVNWAHQGESIGLVVIMALMVLKPI